MNIRFADKVGPCGFCQMQCQTVCTNCSRVYYCSATHLTEHWPTHRSECLPFKIIPDPNKFKGGRWIASRNLKPGEIVLDEFPAIYGPHLYKNDPRQTCLSCCTVLNTKSSCSRCGFPICGPLCEKNPIHADNECRLLSANIQQSCFPHRNPEQVSNRSLFSKCILMIRAAALKKSDSPVFDEFISLRSTYPNPNNTDFQESRDKLNISSLKLLKSYVPLTKLEFPDEFYLKIGRICCFNGILHEEVKSTIFNSRGENQFQQGFSRLQANDYTRFRDIRCMAIYPKSSFLTPCCMPNCTWSISCDRSFKIRIRTCFAVNKDEELTIPWNINGLLSSSLLDKGTAERQRILKSTYGIRCSCDRCTDPAELGLYSSGVSCVSASCREKRAKKLEYGYYLPEIPLHANNPVTMWRCSICTNPVRQGFIFDLVDRIRQYLQTSVMNHKNPYKIVESFANVSKSSYSKDIHPNNGLFIEFALKVLDVIRKMQNIDINSHRNVLQNHIALMEYILGFRSQIYPGLSNQRASLFLELSTILHDKLERYGSILPKQELANDYFRFMGVSKGCFEYYMDDFTQPGEDFNFNAATLFRLKKKVQNVWEIKIQEAILLGIKIPEDKRKIWKIYLHLLHQVYSARELRRSIKSIKI